MVSTNDMRPGQSIIVDNVLYQILEYQHVKPGKGKAFVKTKLKNLSNGGNIEKTFIIPLKAHAVVLVQSHCVEY